MPEERNEEAAVRAGNFIHDIIDEELAPGGRCEGKDVYKRQVVLSCFPDCS